MQSNVIQMRPTTGGNKNRRCKEHRRHTAGCPSCRAAARAYNRYISQARQAGSWSGPVDLAPVMAHLARLTEAGMTLVQIADRAGVNYDTVRRLGTRNSTGKTRYDTAAALLGVRLPQVTQLRGYVSAVGVQRRLRALACEGWRADDIADLMDVVSSSVKRWNRPVRLRVRVDQATRFAHLYTQLRDKPGRNRLAAARAAGRGWLPRRMWPDDAIDDPAYNPLEEMAKPVGVRRRLRAMAYLGHGPADVAPLVGETAETVTGWMTDGPVPCYARHLVAAVYEELSTPDNLGPDEHAKAMAIANGWASPAAWWDQDIDSPAAKARLDAKGPSPDEINVDRINAALAGLVPCAELTRAERVQAVTDLHDKGFSDREIALRLRWRGRNDGLDAVLAFRRNHLIGIAAKQPHLHAVAMAA